MFWNSFERSTNADFRAPSTPKASQPIKQQQQLKAQTTCRTKLKAGVRLKWL